MSEEPGKVTDATNSTADELARRRSGARRTAIVLGIVVTVIFVAFLITGVTGRGQ